MQPQWPAIVGQAVLRGENRHTFAAYVPTIWYVKLRLPSSNSSGRRLNSSLSIRELRTIASTTSSALRRHSRAADFTGAENAFFIFSRNRRAHPGLPDDPEKAARTARRDRSRISVRGRANVYPCRRNQSIRGLDLIRRRSARPCEQDVGSAAGDWRNKER